MATSQSTFGKTPKGDFRNGPFAKVKEKQYARSSRKIIKSKQTAAELQPSKNNSNLLQAIQMKIEKLFLGVGKMTRRP